jgi:hypothetical protein
VKLFYTTLFTSGSNMNLEQPDAALGFQQSINITGKGFGGNIF